MKKLLFWAIAIVLTLPISAKTLRVNNTVGSGAQYATFEAAMEAAEDGDVIIVDGSLTSYGDIEIYKRVTVQGPGYFLEENGLSDVGNQESVFGIVTISAEGAKITGLRCGDVYLKASDIIITRCHLAYILTKSNDVTRSVIHQNYLLGIDADNGKLGTFFQVTNNIFYESFHLDSKISRLDQSVISRNSFNGVYHCRYINNSTFSYNRAAFRDYEANNSFIDNLDNEEAVYGRDMTDITVKKEDAKVSTEHGAFSGEDPYVLAGKTTGVYIKSVSIPESVVQGETLEGHITIELSR